MKKVTDVYCWLGDNPDEGVEGLVAHGSMVDGIPMMVPLMMTSNGDLTKLRPLAELTVKSTGRSVRLARFQLVEVLDEIKAEP